MSSAPYLSRCAPWFWLLLSCGDVAPLAPPPPLPLPSPEPKPVAAARSVVRSALESLGTKEQLWSRYCAVGGVDRVTRYLCSGSRPTPGGLAQLLAGLDLLPTSDGVHFTLTANSTALGLRSVNPLNPRAIVFDGVPREWNATREFLALGFTRGEQIVELVTRDERTHELSFSLLMFEQACNVAGCTLMDLLSEAVERRWTSIVPVHESDLANSIADCRHCHQPGGPGTPKFLRMQELSAPWTHFWDPASVDGAALIRDFDAAHPGSEGYAGIPAWRLRTGSEPGLFSSLVAQEGGAVQPNEFKSFPIALEIQFDGKSAAWTALYEEARRGRAIPVPFWGLRVTDAERQASVASAYRRVVEAGSEELMPDLRDLLSVEAELAMSIRPAAGANGREMLAQLCQRCHNSQLDGTLSRSQFNVEALDRLSPRELDIAIERLSLPASDLRRMPPLTTATLSAAQIAEIESVLKAR